MTTVLTIPTRETILDDAERARNAMASGRYYDGIEPLDRLAQAALLLPDLNALPRLVAEAYTEMQVQSLAFPSAPEPTIEGAVELVLSRRAA